MHGCDHVVDDASESAGDGGRTDVRLRRHLNLLYGLRPVPEDFMQLIREVERRRQTEAE